MPTMRFSTALIYTGLGFAFLLVNGCRDGGQEPDSPSGSSPGAVVRANLDSSVMGQWSSPFPWPDVAVHLTLLPDGRVLTFGRTANAVPFVWDPVSGTSIAAPSPSNLFCAGHALLPDGTVFVNGGHTADRHGLPNANIFDYRTSSWTAQTPMKYARWYPTTVMMGTGEMVTMAGTDQAAKNVLIPEVWTAGPGGGQWRQLTTASRALPYYPRAFLAPNGRIFYAGEQQPSRYLRIAGTGSWSSSFARKVSNRNYGAAVMYWPGKVIYIGGGITPVKSAETIDLTAPGPAWQLTSSMAFARRHLNATLLPTGDVLVTGGTSSSGFNNLAGSVHQAEVWNPQTGTWTTLAPNAVNRSYHSTTILLPDGRILHTGSGDYPGAVDEFNAELFSPPYLFRGPRPTITNSPSSVTYGQTAAIATPDTSIAKVTWVRLMSTSHAFDMNQRFVELTFTRSPGQLNVDVPTNRNQVPPGHYMQFLVDSAGIPSVASIVQVL